MRTQLAFCTIIAALLASCSSTNPYLENRMVLENAMVQLDDGRFLEGARSLESFLNETEEERREFALQRFFAAFLLTEVHHRASWQAPFLEEPVAERDQFDVRAGASEGAQPSRIGHLMAMTYHSSLGRAWYSRAGRSPTEVDGEALLPPELESLGARRAVAYMNLCFLAVHSELNFQDRVEEVLLGMEELADLPSCEQLMDDVGLPAMVRPWVYLGIFEHQKRRDEPNAYRFGIRARETGKQLHAFGAVRMAEIARWITDESSYRFVSPANQPFDPALEGCTVTGTPNLMYEAALRE